MEKGEEMNLFIPSKELGVLEATCYEPLRNTGVPLYSARDRARLLKRAIRVLKDLKILPGSAEVDYFGFVVSQKGEQGFLISFKEKGGERGGEREEISTSLRNASAPASGPAQDSKKEEEE
jgi:hypothetical protein